MDTAPSVYRMKVHLFGAASSPGCANFGLKHLAAQGQGQFSEETRRFIQRDFYVDDGLTSVANEDKAIQLVKESRELCSTGKLRLHKFVSNSKNVKKKKKNVNQKKKNVLQSKNKTWTLEYNMWRELLE